MDTHLVRWLNHQALTDGAVGRVATWSTQHLALVFVATLAVCWTVAVLYELRRDRRLPWPWLEAALRGGLALAIGLTVNQVIGHLWFRPRPFDAIPQIGLLVPPSADPSFPSDHATAAFALTLAIVPVDPFLGALLLGESVVLVVGRVAVGLHYPTDMVGGCLIALIAVAVADSLVLALRGPRTRLAGHWPAFRAAGGAAIPPQTASPTLRAAGLGAALLGLPFLLEAVADPSGP
jgi:undecaprenyl-diphosphatase